MTTTIDSPVMPVAGPERTADRLTSVLLGPDARREHGFWQRLIATEPFRRPAVPPPGPTPDERLALAHARLRTLNNTLDSGARLAADPRALAALHEWLAPVDTSLATVAGIHYNLFLGSLLDHDTDRSRDLSDFLAMRRIGTFLCTEVAHGNDAAAVETTATYDRARDGFVLHTPHLGAQKFMPNTSPAGGPKSGLVAARLLIGDTDHGVFLLLVPLTDASQALPGVRIRRLLYPDGQPSGPLPDLLRPGLRGARGAARWQAGADRRRRGVPQRHRGAQTPVPRLHRPRHHGPHLHERERDRLRPSHSGRRGPLLRTPVRLRGPCAAAAAGDRPPQPSRSARRCHGHRLRDEPAAPAGPRPLGGGGSRPRAGA